MKIIVVVLMLSGMLVFQSKLFSGEFKLVVAISGICCFLGLIGWAFYSKKKAAIDPVLMMNDIDVD